MAGSPSVESNLDKLLQSVTPVVPLKPIPESCIHALNRVWNPAGKPITEYFMLGDLWKRYKKWSVYGVETPVALNNKKDVVQYFTPYLSAIEIFTNKSRANISKAWDVDSEDSSIDHGDSFSTRDCRSNLYIKFHDPCSPYWRIPLRNKIKELAKDYPGLVTLRSTDLSPASWMAVAWYPIYHIPSMGPVKDLSAAFLTFHTLSSYFQDTTVDAPNENNRRSKEVHKRRMSLPPFGLASYMLIGDVWLNHGESDYVRLFDLHRAADSWLKQLDFTHHDFTFFTMRSSTQG